MDVLISALAISTSCCLPTPMSLILVLVSFAQPAHPGEGARRAAG